MSTVRIQTSELIMLLSSLVHTAARDVELGAVAGVLIHSTRGHHDVEPGATDLLVGTSTDQRVIGHAYTDACGRFHRPTLWRIDDVHTIIAAYKPKAKNKDHAVEIELADESVVIREDEGALFAEDGMRLEFSEGTITDYPRNTWELLASIPGQLRPRVPGGSGVDVPPRPRTDIPAPAIDPFVRVAKARAAPIELYRWHQRLPVHVQIGGRYRGLLLSTRWDDEEDVDEGDMPSVDVQQPDLPPPPDAARQPTGDSDDADQVLAEFPTMERDPELLCQAAEVVITAQTGSVSLLQRKLRIGHAKATRLMDQLAEYDVVGPAERTHQARTVRTNASELPTVLATIRGSDAEEGSDG